MENGISDFILQVITRSDSLGVAIARETGELTFVNKTFCSACKDSPTPRYLQDLFSESVGQDVQGILTSEGVHHFFFEVEETLWECIVAVSPTIAGAERTVLSILVPQKTNSATLKAIGQVTGKYGHDFNNLLGAIRASTELLEHKLKKIFGAAELPVDRQVRIVNSSVTKAVTLTAQMRGYASREPMHRGAVKLTSLVEGLVAVLRDSGALSFEVVLECKEDRPISGDEFLLSQAFQSVILNAVEAMSTTSDRCIALILEPIELPEKRGTLRAGSYMQFLCIDHGAGMESPHVQRAFEPFFSTKYATTGTGLGIGLSMARQIILEHEGDITLKSMPNTGTVVQILLPVA